MIKGLILSLMKTSRDATILISGIFVFVWAFNQLNPASVIGEAENRQIAYVDKRLEEKEKVDEVRHKETMGAISRIDRSIEIINEKIDMLAGVRSASTRKDSNNQN